MQHLFGEYYIGPTTAPSKVFFAPINTGFALNGEPTQQLLDFHSARSGNAIGVSYVGNVAISESAVTNPNTAYFTKNDHGWIELAKIIADAGSVPGIQLAGRLGFAEAPVRWKERDQEGKIAKIREHVKERKPRDIEKTISEFVTAADRAIGAGFSVIQIHAAHGYFLSELCSPTLNQRKDAYGWSQMPMVLHDLFGRIKTIAPYIGLDLRISLTEGLESEDTEISQKDLLIEGLKDSPLDMISLSNGIYELDKELIYPLRIRGHAPWLSPACSLATRFPDLKWNLAGNIWDLAQIPDTVPSNLSFSLGRPLIADPNFVEKWRQGASATIKVCKRTNKCHYYSRGKPSICCPVSDDLPSD